MKFDQENIQVDNQAVIRVYLNFGVEVRICPNKSLKVFNYSDKRRKICSPLMESVSGSIPRVVETKNESENEEKKQIFCPRPRHRPSLLCAAYCTTNGYHTSIDHPSASIRHKGDRLDVTLPGSKRVVFNARKNLIKFCHMLDNGSKAVPGQGIGFALGYTLDETGIGFLFDHLPLMPSPPQASFSSTSIFGYNVFSHIFDSGDNADSKKFKEESIGQNVPAELGHNINEIGMIHPATSEDLVDSITLHARVERQTLQKKMIMKYISYSYEMVKKCHFYDDRVHKSTCILIAGFRIVQNNISGELEIRDLLSSRQYNPILKTQGHASWVICMIPCLNKIWIETGVLKISVESNGVVSIKNEELKLDATPLRLTVNNQKFAAGFNIDGDLFLKKLR